MTRWLVLVLVLVAACGGEQQKTDTEEPSTDTAETGTEDTDPLDTDDTGTEVQGTITAHCAQTPENVLRYHCTVEVDPPGPVTIRMQKAAGGGEREFHSSAVAAEHELLLYLMAPRTDYTWVASSTEQPALRTTGAFTTLPAPSGAQVQFNVSGVASFPYFVASTPCAASTHAIIASTEGELLWYEDFRVGGPHTMLDAVSFTEDGTILVISAGSVIEKDLAGNELLRLERFNDYPERVHHDVFRKDGLTWVLHNHEVIVSGTPYVLDGFYVFDQSGALVKSWRLADHHLPSPTGGPTFSRDYSHANSIWVSDDDEVFLSMRHLSSVIKVNGDLSSPEFGEIEWVLAGDPDYDPLGSDFTLSSAQPGASPTFLQQHNAHLLADGTLALFDNRKQSREPSRLLHLSVDPVGGEAVIEAAYELPMHCPFQGGAWHTAGRNPVATCSPQVTAFEFDRGVTDTARWSVKLSCFSTRSGYVPRIIPLEASDLR